MRKITTHRITVTVDEIIGLLAERFKLTIPHGAWLQSPGPSSPKSDEYYVEWSEETKEQT